MRAVLAKIVAGLPEFSPFSNRDFSPEERQYLAFYNLDVTEHPNGHHDFGHITFQERKIAVHLFSVSNPVGTVVLVHGYYDHAGILANIIHTMVGARLNVVVYDQPGHGLSEGARADIDSFSDYSELCADIVKRCRDDWGLTGPLHLVGHSLGGATIADLLLNGKLDNIGKIILIAPLCRSKLWGLSGVGNWLASPFRKDVTRVFRSNSRDKAFRAFVKNDPLQPRVVPFKFVKAHRAWEAAMRESAPVDHPVTILQGKKDTVVDFRYNIKFYKKRFPKHTVMWYKKGGHQLMNESQPLRDQVLKDIKETLRATTSAL
ncbi:MAG: alpha/beta hydrolase [Lentisphaeria bacterium]|nr:alpha/beta hydrolase [Lentisphaeria bacterium]